MINKIAFVVLNFKTYDDTIELLYNLKKQTWFDDVKVYVVDNGSNNGSVENIIKIQNSTKFELIVSKENLGFANGNNLGIKKAKEDGCKFVICLNSDILLENQKEFLDAIDTVFSNDNNIAIIAPNIKNLDGIYQNPFRKERFSEKEILKMKLFYLTGFFRLYYFLRVYVFLKTFLHYM